MRLLCAVVVLSFLTIPVKGAFAINGPSDQRSYLVSTEQREQQFNILGDIDRQRTEVLQKASDRPLTLRDLLFKKESPKADDKSPESVALEPWVPGRGAVGVKVEVTW